MSNVRWSIVVPEEIDRALRSYLAQRGTKKGDISRFVEEAVQARLFELTVETVKERNQPHDQNEILEAIEDALADFEVDGFTHIVVVPSAFPTTAIHTTWDVANAAVGRAVLPEEGVVMQTRPSGMNVYYSSEGIADIELVMDEIVDLTRRAAVDVELAQRGRGRWTAVKALAA